jgi:hypothetical protein
MGVAIECQLCAAPLDDPFGLTYGEVRTGKDAVAAHRQLIVSADAENRLVGVAVPESRLDPSNEVAMHRHFIQGR